MAQHTPRTGRIELRTIDFVPESERHGKAWHQFTLWFGANSVIVSVVTASLLVSAGMNLGWSILAVVIGMGLGAFFSAFHAAQGPKLGIPQMIQSRAQFGYVGGAMPMGIALVNYLVFFAASPAICGQLLAAYLGWNPYIATIAVTAVTVLLALFGYDLTHRVAKYLSVLAVLVFGIFTVLMFTGTALPAPQAIDFGTGFDVALFFGGIALTFVYAAGYAPYIADYSRYLPSNTSIAATGWWTYAGIALSGIWLFVIGAYLFAATGYNGDILGSVLRVSDAFTPVFTMFFVFSILAIQVLQGSLSLYAGGNTLLSLVHSLRRKPTPIEPSLKSRLGSLLPFSAVGLAAAIAYSTSFTELFGYALSIVLLLLIPWSAINLVDFYFVRKTHYDIEAIFDPNGIYGRVNSAGMWSYLIGVLIPLPFADLGFYTGPIANALGFDLSWLVGTIVAGVLFYVLSKRQGVVRV